MSKYPRTMRNYFINPSFQIRITVYFLAAAVAGTGLLLFLVYGYLSEIRFIAANAEGFAYETQLQINAVISSIIQVSIGFLVLMILVIMGYAVVVSHRIAGPMFAILAYIQQLKAGNYKGQRPLRPYDELAPIMDSLHELAIDLSKKNP